MAKNVMTYEGLQELEKELEHLKVILQKMQNMMRQKTNSAI